MEITAFHSLKLSNPLNYNDLSPSSTCFSAVTVLPHSTPNVLRFDFFQRKLYDAGRLKSIRAINASSNSADGVQKPLLEPIEKSNSFPQKELEQTFIMIKPDGVQRGLVGEIISRFEKKGFTLKGLKFLTVERPFAEKHYTDLSAKPFFKKLVDYIISGPVVAMVWEGKNVVTTGRKIIGTTNPSDSAPGTIRGDFAIDTGRNVIHGSDAVESATKEIALWFPEGVTDWRRSLHSWIYE